MRIVFLSWRDTAHPQAGGSELVVDRLACGLVERGHDVMLFHGGPSAAHPYPSRSTGATYTQYLRTPVSFLRHARNVDVVVDIANGIPFFSPVWQRAPVVVMAHHVHTEQWSMHYPAPVAAVGRWLESSVVTALYRRCSYVGVSQSTKAALIALGVAEHRITTIEMGTEVPALVGDPSPTPKFVVLTRLVAHKRVELALQAWATLGPRIGGELVVVGDGPEAKRLQAIAPANVRFTGWVDEATKHAELSSAWALVHPAHHEGWGIVIMEAAASGVPTLGFDVDGVRDACVDGVTGLLARDEQEFQANWLRLAGSESLRAELSIAARRRAETYTWDRSIDAFERVLVEAEAARRR